MEDGFYWEVNTDRVDGSSSITWIFKEEKRVQRLVLCIEESDGGMCD